MQLFDRVGQAHFGFGQPLDDGDGMFFAGEVAASAAIQVVFPGFFAYAEQHIINFFT